MENINYHDFLNMCRTCMLDIDLKPIEDKTIIEMLEFITDKNFKTNDELPQQICGTCIKKLLDINSFVKQSKNSEENFKKCLANFKNECPSATIDPGDKPVEVYVMEPSEIKQEKSECVDESKTTEPPVNFDSIIKDMRKEFDVPPTPEDPLKTESDSLTTEKTINLTNSDKNSIDSDEDKPIETNRCDVCAKIFATRSSLTRHKRLHSRDNPFKCKKCQKVFSESSHLLKHERIHLGIKPYACEVCSKCFTEMGQLNRHKRTHSGVKPYLCDVCNKVFGNSSGLQKHKRIHSGLRPYKCGVCPKVFRTSSHLASHKFVHADKRGYRCDVCDKVYKCDDHLKKHLKTHADTNDKCYACDVCDKKFSSGSSLGKHKRTQHLTK